MTAPGAPAGTTALRRVGDSGARVLELLAAPGAPTLEAVSWASAHLSAFQHAVVPVVDGELHDAPAAADLRRSAPRVATALRQLERSLSGDAHVPQLDRAAAGHELVRVLEARLGQEQQVLVRLAAALPAERLHALADRYDRALEHAPTRPHPHTPTGAVAERLGFRVNAWRDRLMDGVDARHVPSPRPPARTPVHSKWGDYLLGHGSPPPPP